jgi:CRISPR/Cas system-associated endoribonuclease Cas2
LGKITLIKKRGVPMLKSTKLKKIKNNIIEKSITKEKIEKVKKENMLKGGYLKNVFNYIFLKPFKFNRIKTNEDSFFVNKDGENIIKPTFFLSFVSFIVVGLISSILEKEPYYILVLLVVALLFNALIMLADYVAWKLTNYKIIKRFSVNKIKEIKENLFKNYDEKTQEVLLEGKLNKEDLVNIMKDLNEIIKKEELLFFFNDLRRKNQCNEKFNDISDPYVLIKIINDLIINEEKKEEFRRKVNKEKNINIFNEKIIESLTTTDNEEEEEEELASNQKSIKSLIFGFNNIKEEIKLNFDKFNEKIKS